MPSFRDRALTLTLTSLRDRTVALTLNRRDRTLTLVAPLKDLTLTLFDPTPNANQAAHVRARGAWTARLASRRLGG